MINTEVRKTVRGGRKMTEEELQAFIKTIRYGTLSYVNGEGWPEQRPLNFGYYNGCYYFHAHKLEGEKLKDWEDGAKVVISFYETTDKLGVEHINTHKSVLVYGRLERLDGKRENFEEMKAGIKAMCEAAGTAYKAAPGRLERNLYGTGVFKVVPEETIGKMVCFASTPD